MTAEDLLFLCTECGELTVQKSKSAEGKPYWSITIRNPSLSCSGYYSFEDAANAVIYLAKINRGMK